MNQKNCGIFGTLRKAIVLVISNCAMFLAVTTYGTSTWIWTGGGAPGNGNWNNSANWGSAGIPANGDSVVFQGSTGLNSTNNIASLTLGQIKFISGGFNIYGNPFTLTNGIVATNFTGSLLISNSFTIATTDATILTSNSVTLTLKGNISGSVGVVKAGAGTVIYNGPNNNTYSGTTLVSDGLLELNVGGVNAFSGPLIIGDGINFNSPEVRHLQSTEIPDTAPITINPYGLLNLNSFNEVIGPNLTLSSGSISSGAGTLTLSPNTTITMTSNGGGFSSISGNLNIGSGTLTLQGNSTLSINANVSGSANIVQNDFVNTAWYGVNTYLGDFTANTAGYVDLQSSQALGNTNNSLTLNGQSLVAVASVNITNRTLTINSTNVGYTLGGPYGTIYAFGVSNVWQANFVFGSAFTISVPTNDAFILVTTTNMSGPGGFTKIAPGSLTLAGTGGSSSYMGDTIVNEGTLFLDSANVIRHGTLRIGDGVGGAQVDVVRYLTGSCIYGGPGGSTVFVSSSGLLDLNGYFDDVGPITMDGGTINTGASGTLDLFEPLSTLGTGNGSSTINGNFELFSGNSRFFITNDLTINAAVSSGSQANLIKTGNGYMYLTAANTYTGSNIIQQGWIYIKNGSALGNVNNNTFVANGASLAMLGNFGVTNASLILNGPGESAWGALDSETGGGTNLWFGPIILNAGGSTLAPFGVGSVLRIMGTISGIGGIEEFGSGTLSLEGGVVNTYAGITTIDSGSTLSLNKSSGAAVPGNVDIKGTLRYANNNQIADAADVFVESSGTYDFASFFDDINTLHGTGSVTFGVSGYLDIGAAGGTSTFDGLMSGPGFSGGYTVGKYGAGTFTMTANNTFQNALAVIGGTLLVDGNQSQNAVEELSSGATFGGTGTVSSFTGIFGMSGTVAPGNNGPGVLACSNITFTSSSTFKVELTGPNPGAGGYDQLNVSGSIVLANATLTIVPAFTSPVPLGQQFTIIQNDLSDVISGTFNGLPQGSTITLGSYKFTISYTGGTGNDVVLTLVSTPGAVVASSVTSGDGSHGIDPNGCNNLTLVASNTTASTMTGVTAVLSTTTEGVIISQPYATYPNITAGHTGTNVSPFQISTLTNFVCGTPIALQLSINSSIGLSTVNYTLNTGESGPSSRYDVTGNVSIPDIGSADSTNIVSGFTGTPLQKVVVSLYLTHPFDSDLTNISLISPDGVTVLLSSANGGSGANYGAGLTPDSNRTTFDDAGSTAITAGTAPFVGTFRPQSSLSAFAGDAVPNGGWHLHIADGFGGSLGTLRGWSLFLYGTDCSAGSGVCDSCIPPIVNAITLTDPVQTNRWFRDLFPSSYASPKAWAGIGNSGTNFHYDAYAFTNTSSSAAAVSVVLQSTNELMAALYLNSYDATSISSNWVGDAGYSTGTPGVSDDFGLTTTFSSSVPAGARFVVVVNEVNQGFGTQPYTLTISGIPCPPPTLNIQSVAPGKARLYWDTSAGGYQLQSVSNLTATAWGSVTNEPIVSGGVYSVTNSTIVPGTNRFYRLYKQ